jgi:glycosyltransferase involved in cell wall biosynthesis
MMKILWLVPLVLGKRLQITSRNELAMSLKGLGHEINTVVGLCDYTHKLDGFSNVKYVNMDQGSFAKTIQFHLAMLFSLWRTEADIVIFGTSSAHLLPFAYFFRYFGKSPILILDIRTVPVDVGKGLKGKFQIWRYYLSLKLADSFCDGITVITPMLAKMVQPYLKRISGSLGVWSSGVRFEHFKPNGPSLKKYLGLQRKKILFYHGILSLNRGIQNAIKAVALLKRQIPNLVFLLVGDGAGRQEFIHLAKELDISDRLIITGRVSYTKIPKYLRVADIGILPFPALSCWEVSSPIKLMEYLAMKIPVIATDITAHRTVLDKTGGGFMIPNNKPDTIANCIRQVLRNEYKFPPQKNLEEIISWNAQAKKLEFYLHNLGEKKNKES